MTEAKEYRIWRNRYRPKKVKILFIAESPPISGEFFYFDEDTKNYNASRGYNANLFSYMMKFFYRKEYYEKLTSKNKKYFLLKFQKDGYFLIDASETPINNISNSKRREIINKNLLMIIDEIKKLRDYKTKIILIKKTTVCRILYYPIKDIGFCHVSKVSFPSSGNQNKFIEEMNRII